MEAEAEAWPAVLARENLGFSWAPSHVGIPQGFGGPSERSIPIQASLSPGGLSLDPSLSLVLFLYVSKEPCASTLAGTSNTEV